MNRLSLLTITLIQFIRKNNFLKVEVRARCDLLLDTRGRLEARLGEKRKRLDDLLAALECTK